jgi:hypothetical protein
MLDQAPPPGSETKKKTYERPRVVSREPLEAMAAICRPAPPNKANAGACPTGTSNS